MSEKLTQTTEQFLREASEKVFFIAKFVVKVRILTKKRGRGLKMYVITENLFQSSLL